VRVRKDVLKGTLAGEVGQQFKRRKRIKGDWSRKGQAHNRNLALVGSYGGQHSERGIN
jgi:hypothetical protein